MPSSFPNPPPAVVEIAELMSSFGQAWALCGGWAVDAWLGRQTRNHEDIDIAVFRDDHQALFEQLAGWQLIAHGRNVAGDGADLWDGGALPDLPAHIHARRGKHRLPGQLDDPSGAGFELDIQINERSGDSWVFIAEQGVVVPLRRCIRQSRWGLPTALPEVLLFYKALDGGRDRDEADFRALRPLLTPAKRSWLKRAISLSQPAHPWLPHLAG